MTVLKTLCLLIYSVVLATPAARSESKVDFSATPVVMSNSGSTDYTIEALTFAVSEDLVDTSLVGIRSTLEFPLDLWLAGVKLNWEISSVNEKGWSIEVGAFVGITDPDRMMEDHDWFFDPQTGAADKFSWTESRAELSYLLLKLEAAKTVARSDKHRLALMAGFHFNRVEFDMIGFDGWQGDEGNRISGEGRSLYYKATYKLPHLGARLSLSPGRTADFELQLAAGRLMASDFDDHLLRGKTAEASATGWAFLGHVEGRVMLTGHGSKRPFIIGRAELVRQSASGRQTQKWYRDEVYIDPNTGEEVIAARRGTVISGIDYETTARQLRIGLGVGVAF